MGARFSASVACAVAAVALAGGCAERRGGESPLGPPCDRDAEVPGIGGALELELYRGEEIDEAYVRALAAEVAAYFDRFQLELMPRGPVIELADEPMIIGAGANAGDDAQALAAAMLAPLRDFVRTRAAEPDGAIRVIALGAIAARDSPASAMLGELRGLTFSPAMHSPLWGSLALEQVLGDHHAPVILLAPSGDRRADARVLAHELGHALGLEHRHHPHNLMTQHEPACAPALDATQAAQMRRALPHVQGR